MAAQLSPDMLQKLFALRDALAAAPRGEQTERVKAFAEFIGKKPNTVYRWLKDHSGRKTNRSPRADKGKTSVPIETLEMLAGMKREAVRGNGNKTLPTGVAMNILHTNGVEITVSKGRYNAILREKNLDVDSIMASRSHIQTRPEHVNQVFQVDPSLCVIYYMHGKQFIMRDDFYVTNKIFS